MIKADWINWSCSVPPGFFRDHVDERGGNSTIGRDRLQLRTMITRMAQRRINTPPPPPRTCCRGLSQNSNTREFETRAGINIQWPGSPLTVSRVLFKWFPLYSLHFPTFNRPLSAVSAFSYLIFLPSHLLKSSLKYGLTPFRKALKVTELLRRPTPEESYEYVFFEIVRYFRSVSWKIQFALHDFLGEFIISERAFSEGAFHREKFGDARGPF